MATRCKHIKLALDEVRMMVLGVQVLISLPFELAFQNGFGTTSELVRQLMHLACLSMIALTVILLITPAAFHRIAEHGEDSERLVKLTGRFVMAATVPLAAAIGGEVYVVILRVMDSSTMAIVAAVVTFVASMAMWFGYTLWRRRQPHQHEGPGHSAAALAH